MDYEIEKLLKQITELEAELKTAKKYGLVWDKENIKEDVVLQCETSIPVLSIAQSLKSKDSTTNHMLIEGDNYHSLIALNYILKGSVDVIYIDPPYNTGNNDFCYNDRFVNEDDGYQHSKWLQFMSKRLILARELLKDDGFIFISIDDHEYANLKLLCDSIFGERHFIDNFIWNSTFRPTNVTNKTRGNAEYVLCYSKTSNFKFIPIQEDTKGDFSLTKKKHTTQILNLPANYVKANFKDGVYKKGDYGNGYTLLDDITVKKGVIINKFAIKIAQSIWSDAHLQDEISKGVYLVIKNPKTMVLSARKTYQKSSMNPTKIIDNQVVGDVLEANAELARIFNKKEMFDYPKPTSLIKYLLSISLRNDGLVLDFFAGSGTTGQAVLELNGSDNGNRRFILCTNNEGNICTDVTFPRLKTVATGVRPDGSHYGEKLPSNIYYFKTDFIKDESNTEQAKFNLVEKVDALLCIAENIFDEVERNEYSSHYKCGNKHMFIYNDYYNIQKFNEFKERVLSAQGEIIVYIYSSDNSVDESLIEGNNITLKPIPSKIYEIYKEIVEDIKRDE